MKRRLLATTLVGLGAMAAHADNSINLVDRTDFRSQFFADSTQGQDNNQFDENYLRVDFKGNIFENVDYRLRLRLDKTSAKDNLKGISDFANYAYVQPKFGDNFSVKIGKLWTYQAGWEEDNSSSDTYLFSGIDNLVNNYALGVNPTISLDKQNNIQVIVTNSDVAYPGTYPGAPAERYLDYGIAYQGMLADVIQPMLSFTVMPQTGWSKGSMIGGAGIKVDPAPIGGELDFEYWNNSSGLASKNTNGGDQLYTVAGCARYNPGSLRPQLKIFYDTYTYASKTTDNVLGFAPAIEYFPWADHDFRFHLAYTGTDNSPKIGKSEYNSQVFLGVKGTWSIK
jgi:hypothetical protein